jgi:hypothetical protein
MNRFADADCSFKRLTPVYGFRSEKLVSLEEALERLHTQIDQLAYYIKIAKKHCHYPSEHHLTKDESASIYIYTMEWGEQSLYRVLKSALRDENRQALTIWFPYLKLFDTALNKLPTVKGNLWRGIREDVGKNFYRDQLVTWWSINSCSTSVNAIQNFLRNETKSTMFVIEALHGKQISQYSKLRQEAEVILMMGTQFRVKADPLISTHGQDVVHLVEIGDENDSEEEQATASALDNLHLSTMTTVKDPPSMSHFTSRQRLIPSSIKHCEEKHQKNRLLFSDALGKQISIIAFVDWIKSYFSKNFTIFLRVWVGISLLAPTPSQKL